MVNYSEAVKKGIKFALDWRRIVFQIIIFTIILALIGIPMIGLFSSMMASAGVMPNMGAFAGFGLWILIGFVVTWIIGAFATATIIDNYRNPKSFKASMQKAPSYIVTLILMGIIVAIVNIIISIIGVIPFIGWIINILGSIILFLLFFFMNQEVVLGESGVSDTIKNLWDILTNNILLIILTAIVSFVVSGLIMIVFAIPLLIVSAGIIITMFTDPALAMSLIMSNSVALIITGIIAGIGAIIAQLTNMGILCDVYTQLKPTKAPKKPVKKAPKKSVKKKK